MKIMVLNGPNLNLLGVRETDIYGDQSFEDYLRFLKSKYADIEIAYYQSNVEGELVNKLHEVGFDYDGIIFNAAAYTHTSIALHDAVKSIKTPVIEVHISNTGKREDFRHQSFLTSVCKGTIAGFGLCSYELALQAFLLDQEK